MKYVLDDAKWSLSDGANCAYGQISFLLAPIEFVSARCTLHCLIRHSIRERRAKVSLVAVAGDVSTLNEVDLPVIEACCSCFYAANQLVVHVDLDVVLVAVMDFVSLDCKGAILIDV